MKEEIQKFSRGIIRDLSFDSEGYKISGTLYKSDPEAALVIFIQGGAKLPRKNGPYTKWQEHLMEKSISSFIFDYRGLGESEGNFSETSLKTRCEDVKNAIEFLKTYSKNVPHLIAISMGGPVAIRIAEDNASGLILLVSAAYSEEAWGKKFGPDFKEAITKPESWINSPDFTSLQRCNNKLMLFYAENDEIIPKAITDRYAEIVKSKNGKVLVGENDTHTSWKEDGKRQVLDAIIDFVK